MGTTDQVPRGDPGDVPLVMIVTHSVAASLGLLSWWLEHDRDISPEKMGEVIDRLVLAPVRRFETAGGFTR